MSSRMDRFAAKHIAPWLTDDKMEEIYQRTQPETRRKAQQTLLSRGVPPNLARWFAWNAPLFLVRWYLEARTN